MSSTADTAPPCTCALCAGTYATADAATADAIAPSAATTSSTIAALLYTGEPKWGTATAGTAATVTYSFMTAAPSYAFSYDRSGFAAMTSVQQTAVRAAFAAWSEVANITFTEVSDSGSGGTIRLGTNNQNGESAAYAYRPGTTSGVYGDIYLANDQSSNVSPTAGTYGYLTILHEIGHAIGLKHPGNYNAGGGGSSGPYLSSSEDNYQYSIMSYYSHPSLGYNGLATGPALYDIAAIQYLYGANTTTRTGDTTYSFNDNASAVSQSIWDAGGTDTIDASGQTSAVTIQLTAGSFSSIGPNGSGGRAASNISIAYGAVIENAVGGSGADTLTGNSAANTLTGGAGNDTLTGGDGNDTLAGGTGSDTATASGNRADYTIGRSGTAYTLAHATGGGADGTDTLTDIEYVQFANTRVSLSTATVSAAGAAARSLATGTSVLAGTLFSASDPGGNVIAGYELRDDTAATASGYFTLSGVSQAASTTFSASDLAAVRFVAGTGNVTDSLYVRAYNGVVWSDWTLVSVSTIINSAPVVQSSRTVTVQEGAGATALGIAQPTDADGDSLTVSIQGLPSGGTLRRADGSAVTATLAATDLSGLTFTPDSGFSGSAGGFAYTVSDGRGGSASQTVTLTVTALSSLLAGFDPLSYLASYGDLAAAFGTDQTLGRQHYISYGRFEGRSVSFDPIAYIAMNLDIAAAYGTSQTAAAEHYIRYGRAEGRITTGFDALSYLAGSTDLMNAFGTDRTAALGHYLQYGRSEGRLTFDSAAYLASYGDLIAAFGYDLTAAARHYIENGRFEGRQVTFNATAYLSANADVAAAYGSDTAAAARHYVLYGYAEGRATGLLAGSS